VFYDVERQAALKESRAHGGHGRAKTVRLQKLLPASLRPVLDDLIAALGAVRDGELDPGRGSAMAALANAIVRVYGAGQLEERLAALEQVATEAWRPA